MELWVPITLVAAFMQNLRSALQKHLKDTLSTYGATFCRFVYAGAARRRLRDRFSAKAMASGGRTPGTRPSCSTRCSERDHADHRDRPPRLPLLPAQFRGRHHLLEDRDGADRGLRAHHPRGAGQHPGCRSRSSSASSGSCRSRSRRAASPSANLLFGWTGRAGCHRHPVRDLLRAQRGLLPRRGPLARRARAS